MTDDKHVDVDGLAAFVLGALDGETVRQVEDHLASGCERCRGEREWVERVMRLARSDRSVAAPSHVVARAMRILPAEQSGPSPRERLWRRVRALPLFGSPGTMAAAGARGTGGTTRHVLYRVPELNLEIDVQVQRSPVAVGRLDLRGQVFPTDYHMSSVAGLPVELALAAGSRQTVTSALGEFYLEVPEDADVLVLRAHGHEIEVPVPRL
jgi:hypothetical protein